MIKNGEPVKKKELFEQANLQAQKQALFLRQMEDGKAGEGTNTTGTVTGSKKDLKKIRTGYVEMGLKLH